MLSLFPAFYLYSVPPTPHPKADKHLMGAFAFLGDLKLGIDIFLSSDHPDSRAQVLRLTKLQRKVSPEFHTAFYNESSGVYLSGLQTEQALPLYVDAVPDEVKDSILSHLVDDIRITNNGHTSSGIVGIKYVMEVLSKLDRGDVALDLALQTTYPSWGYMINSKYEPATTVWELWESDFAGPGMNSRNHHMFGSITSWFYKYVAGIQPLDPGFSRVQIRPNLLRHDKFAATVSTPQGLIHIDYFKQYSADENDSIDFFYEITLPPCTRGIFHVPIAMDDREFAPSNGNTLNILVEESGDRVWHHEQFISGSNGLLQGEKIGRHLRFEISNGNYRFKVTVSKKWPIATTTMR